MQETTFGYSRLAPPRGLPDLRVDPDYLKRTSVEVVEQSWLDTTPLVTGGLVLLLLALFGLELTAAGGEAGLGYRAVVALGGVNGALAIGGGQWWRVFTAPLLHGGWVHVLGNGLVLGLIGWRLERLLGRPWFAAIFAVSAVGGSLGSVMLNPNGPVSLGASGAIMGLLAAAFVASFHVAAFESAGKLRAVSLRWLIPALIPMSGGTDYSCHIGGALTGVGLGVVLHLIWPEMSDRPRLPRFANSLTFAGAALSLIAFGLIALHLPGYARDRGLIPDSELPTTEAQANDRAVMLEMRYPKDPRAHLLRATGALRGQSYDLAESELRTGLALVQDAPADIAPQTGHVIRAMLAATVKARGRLEEARAIARPLCTPQGNDLESRRLTSQVILLDLCPQNTVRKPSEQLETLFGGG